VLVVGLVLPVTASARAPQEYQQRRQAVRDAMDPGSVMVVRNMPITDDSGLLRLDPNFQYLTGVTDPGAALVLYASKWTTPEGLPPGVRLRVPTEMLFKAVAPPPAGRSGQAAAGTQDAPTAPGFAPGTVRRAADFQAAFDSMLLSSSTLYLDYRRSRVLNGPMTEDEQLLKQARDRGAAPTIKPVSAVVAKLRVIKSSEEIRLLRQAAEITAAAEREAMRAAKPGLFEYQIQSIIEHVFTINGARRPGFTTIVGSGPNSCILHWSENTRQTQAGDLAVIDIGAEYEGYSGDITRTIPMSGTFTKRQRDIYEIVLAANEQAIEMLKPGASMRDVGAKVQDVLGEGLLKLGVIKDKAETIRYSLHGPTHPIGLQVHDVGSTAVLEAGMVVTIEPGLYLPEESLGIRVEDDVLVTPGGHEVITASAPKSIEAIEALMKQGGGIDFRRYLVPKIGTN
jgi:Xaa-Pro aminopeptidase